MIDTISGFDLLLEGYRRITLDNQIDKFRSLAKDFGTLYQRLQEDRRLRTPRFNVFAALGVDRREIYHSRFLAYLLDPTAQHDQGDAFLKKFLEAVLGSSSEPMARPVKVRTEYPIGQYGRIDICIFLPNRIIAIENKVDRSERGDQISDYQQWLLIQRNKFPKHTTLVFLTPTGRAPTEGGQADSCLSYQDLANILESADGLPSEGRLSQLIDQYAEICKQLWESHTNEQDR